MSGLNAPFYPWPYVEGVTIDEAANDLAFISTGMYGKPLPPQNGGPIRLTLPWKYGFKSAKAIVKITFTDKRPSTFWEASDHPNTVSGPTSTPPCPSALEPGIGTAAGQR